MLAVGTHAQKYAPFLAIGMVVVVAVALALEELRIAARSALMRMILKLPLLGDIWLKYQVANFSRMLSTLLAGGLPLVPSLETAGASMSSRRILNGIAEAAVRVREGQTLSGSLEQQKMFPDLSVEMIEVGESTGALPAMLNSVAEFYEEDVQTALGATMALIEPVILIVMAVFVGGVLISLVSADLLVGGEYSLTEVGVRRSGQEEFGNGKNGGKQTSRRARRKWRSPAGSRRLTWTTWPRPRTSPGAIAASLSICTTSSSTTICSRRFRST